MPADPTPPLTADAAREVMSAWAYVHRGHLAHCLKSEVSECGFCKDVDRLMEACEALGYAKSHAALTAQLAACRAELFEASQAGELLDAARRELAQRTAERDAARERHRAVENILRNVEEHHVQQNQWKGCDETRSHTLKWIREARATLAAPTEG